MPFDAMKRYISEQRLYPSGAVDRPEFHRDYGGADDIDLSTPGARKNLEQFVLRNTPNQHRYMTADGKQGVVYFDSRGRAASGVLEQIPDLDLVHVAHEFSKRFPGEPDHTKPETSTTNHGYKRPVQEAEDLTEEAPIAKARQGMKQIEEFQKAVEEMGRKDKMAAIIARTVKRALGTVAVQVDDFEYRMKRGMFSD